MLHSFGKLFDYLFPPTDEVLLVRKLTPAVLERHYAPHLVGTTNVLLPYHEPEVQALIKAVKFFRDQRAASLLAGIVDLWLTVQTQSFTIVPTPLSRARERERGHNQVLSVLTLTESVRRDHELNATLLVRHKNTTPQTSLHKAERKINVQDAFAATTNSPLTDTHLLIVDDVMTTGATLQAVAASLRPLRPASITKLAFAH